VLLEFFRCKPKQRLSCLSYSVVKDVEHLALSILYYLQHMTTASNPGERVVFDSEQVYPRNLQHVRVRIRRRETAIAVIWRRQRYSGSRFPQPAMPTLNLHISTYYRYKGYIRLLRSGSSTDPQAIKLISLSLAITIVKSSCS
jgi:hypothetical protein